MTFNRIMMFILTVVWDISLADSRYQATICSIIVNNTRLPYDIQRSGPALDMALELVREKYNETIAFNYIYRDGGAACGPTVAGYAAADVFYSQNVSVFIGPGCSLAVEHIAYMASKWNIPVITPAGSAGILADKDLFSTLTRLSFGMQEYAAFYLNIFQIYKWKHIALFYESDDVFSGIIGNTFFEIFRNTELNLIHYEIFGRTFYDSDYEDLLSRGNTYARDENFNVEYDGVVYVMNYEQVTILTNAFVVLATPTTTRKLLLAAHKLQYTNGDHVFIATIPVNYKLDIWQRGDSQDQDAKKACESAMVIALSESFDLEYKNFKDNLKSRAIRDYGFNFGNEEPSVLLAGFYDAVLTYAQVLNETLVEGGNPLDGSDMFNRMKNRTFQGIGGKISINNNGDKYSDFIIYDLQPETGVFEVIGTYDGKTKQYITDPTKSINWPGNKGPPPDVPQCGFKLDLCEAEDQSRLLIIVLSSGFSALFLIATAIMIMCYVRWKKNSEKDIWWWKIPRDELVLVNHGGYSNSFISSHSRRSSFLSETITGTEIHVGIANYKGITVQLREFDIKEVPITNKLFKEFKEIRDINQTNIAKVIGACIEQNYKCIVVEHCSKGTLEDVLGSTEITLDAHFKFSLAIDIAQGMTFIHQSSIHHHGNLSSMVCLIDNRFSVKITDVGLRCLYSRMNTDTTKQEYINECLWKAPEHLRNDDMYGSREGDVYSFGIILQEIVTRESPFSLETLHIGAKDVVLKVKEYHDPPFRPTIDVPPKLAEMFDLMKRCWSEDPRERPAFNSMVKALKQMTSKFGESGNLLDNLLKRMELYANNLEKMVDEKTKEVKEEKKRSEELLYQILPKSVAERLKRGLRVEPEAFDCITIYFSDICGFTTISARSQPMEVVDLLNDLYSCFDAILGEFDVYKVETIGDAYMVASGLPQRNGHKHAEEIAKMSLALLKAIDSFRMRHLPDEKLKLRIGLHSGPVCAGVVGVKMPRYCLFGDTVNTASRMESHGEGLKIHMSEPTTNILKKYTSLTIEKRGNIEIKGKGFMTTYWLLDSCKTTETESITS